MMDSKEKKHLEVALDLEDAYNRVRYDVLLRTMVRLGVRPQLILWIGETLLKRTVAQRLGSLIKMMAIRRIYQRVIFILYQTLVQSMIDFGFGLLTLFATQLRRIEVVQNEGIRTVLGILS